MNNRLFATLIVVCLAIAGAGCASKSRRNREVVLLPLQTGSNINRRIIVDDESSFKTMKRPESKRPSKKRVKTERTESERTTPEQPEETPTPAPPDRFR